MSIICIMGTGTSHYIILGQNTDSHEKNHKHIYLSLYCAYRQTDTIDTDTSSLRETIVITMHVILVL